MIKNFAISNEEFDEVFLSMEDKISKLIREEERIPPKTRIALALHIINMIAIHNAPSPMEGIILINKEVTNAMEMLQLEIHKDIEEGDEEDDSE